MHNSNNSVSSKASFTSSVLAQAALSNITVDYSKLDKVCPQELNGRVHNNNVSEVPIFHASTINLSEVTDETRSALANLSNLVSARELYRNEILADADRMGVPYRLNIQHSDEWADFVDEVYNYEELLSEANSHNIAWDLNDYDPRALNTLIDEARNSVWRADKSAARDYYSSLGLEV